MYLLRILLRVAFICNICFLLTMVILWLPRPLQGEIVSLIIILGCVLAVIVNGVTSLWLGVLFFTRNKLPILFPRWLMTTNFIFFALQLIFILKK